jgi:hypothetical protein
MHVTINHVRGHLFCISYLRKPVHITTVGTTSVRLLIRYSVLSARRCCQCRLWKGSHVPAYIHPNRIIVICMTLSPLLATVLPGHRFHLVQKLVHDRIILAFLPRSTFGNGVSISVSSPGRSTGIVLKRRLATNIYSQPKGVPGLKSDTRVGPAAGPDFFFWPPQ